MSFQELQEQIQELKEAFVREVPDPIVSLVLFGSYVAGDFDPDKSDVNLALVVKRSDPRPTLPAHLIRRSRELLRTPLLIWESDSLALFPAAFPVETSELVEHHRCLHGTDVVAPLVIDPAMLRTTVLSRLLHLHLHLQSGHYSGVADRSPMDSLYDLIFLIRALLRTQGKKPARSKRDSLEQFCEIYDTIIPTAKIILGVRQGRSPAPLDRERDRMFEMYVNDVERVVRIAQSLVPHP